MTRAIHYTATIDLARPVGGRPVGALPPRSHATGEHAAVAVSRPAERPAAYRVPFEVDRFGSERVELRNASNDLLRWVTIDLMGPGHFVAQTPTRLEPGQVLAVWLFGDDLARKTKLQVTWFCQGVQYLWLVSL
jgi:hypothetical protein